MIAVIDYGMSNLFSIFGILRRLNVPYQLVSCGSELAELASPSLLLPGVGSFPTAMKNLQERKFIEPLRNLVEEKGCNILGICLGFQLFHQSSEEHELTKGFGWLPAKVKRIPKSKDLRIPHMGWNCVKASAGNRLFQGIPDESLFYFVHSFYSDLESSFEGSCYTNHGIELCTAVSHGNLHGCQFHPEKSQEAGLVLIKNFVNLCCEKD